MFFVGLASLEGFLLVELNYSVQLTPFLADSFLQGLNFLHDLELNTITIFRLDIKFAVDFAQDVGFAMIKMLVLFVDRPHKAAVVLHVS